MDEQKTIFIINLQNKIAQLALVADVALDLAKVYADRGYGASGSNPITNQQFQAAGSTLTATDLANVITTLEQLNTFMSGGTPVPGDWKAKINVFRNDI